MSNWELCALEKVFGSWLTGIKDPHPVPGVSDRQLVPGVSDQQPMLGVNDWQPMLRVSDRYSGRILFYI